MVDMDVVHHLRRLVAALNRPRTRLQLAGFALGVAVIVHEVVVVEAASGAAQPPANLSLKCDELMPGQYRCDDPEIDPETQQAKDCPEDVQQVEVPCYPVKGVICDGKRFDGETEGFKRKVDCKWTNGHSFSVALLLSVFLGMFGVDRFYLGYPALGLLKLCTLGFMFLGQLLDILLIALQVVGPSDGSHYVIDYYGPGLTRLAWNNSDTYMKPHYQ